MGWPQTDVVENDKEYRVTAELPGLEEKDIDLTFQDGVLTLKGEKKVEHDDESARYSERYYGRFQRSVSLGTDVDEEKVSASFKSGVCAADVHGKGVQRERTDRVDKLCGR